MTKQSALVPSSDAQQISIAGQPAGGRSKRKRGKTARILKRPSGAQLALRPVRTPDSPSPLGDISDTYPPKDRRPYVQTGFGELAVIGVLSHAVGEEMLQLR